MQIPKDITRFDVPPTILKCQTYINRPHLKRIAISKQETKHKTPLHIEKQNHMYAESCKWSA